MIRLLDKSKITLFNYFFAFCFIVIYAGCATKFARELGDIRTLGNAFALGLTILFVILNRVRFTKEYVAVIGVFLTYALITVVVYGIMSTWWISVNFLLLTYGFVLCKSFGKKLPAVFETVLYHMSIISIFFWAIMVISPSALALIVNTFAFSEPHTEDGNVVANMIIYTLNDWNFGSNDFIVLLRNPGFAWEPGAFASMICLGLFCNMIRTNFRLYKNRALWVFVFTLLTTQSTTGLMIYIVMLFAWLLYKRRFLPVILGLFIAAAVFSLPFVQDKLMAEIELTQEVDFLSPGSKNPGRLMSFLIDWHEFLRHPILGLGCNFEGTWINEQGLEISTISGIGELLSEYGAIITLLFFVMLIRSSRTINKDMGTTKVWVLPIVIIGIMISYSLWRQPIFIAFWLYCMFSVNPSKESHFVNKFVTSI